MDVRTHALAAAIAGTAALAGASAQAQPLPVPGIIEPFVEPGLSGAPLRPPPRPATSIAAPAIEATTVRVAHRPGDGVTGRLVERTALIAPRPYATDPVAAAHPVGEPIRFGPGRAHPDAEGAVALHRTAAEIGRRASSGPVHVTVEGHTDASGDAASNLVMAQRRADAVVLELIRLTGLPRAMFSTRAEGEAEAARSIDPNAARHRRAVVRVARGAAPFLSSTLSEDACRLPMHPHGGHAVGGTLVEVRFDEIDDYGGGRLTHVCRVPG